tara:strand:+ start:1038 stop:1556 length:519 start_codon:yes stop_codon:yes gene_type:complete
MTLKSKISKIIEAIKDTDISEIEISSFWGAQKIKLKTKDFNIKDNSIINTDSNDKIPSIDQLNNITSDNDSEQIKDETLDAQNDDESNVNSDNYTIIKAPLVGTYYQASKPGDKPFVEINQNVSVGDSLCIIEAMKIFNTIESEYKGVIKEIFVQDGDPVEFGQPLYSLKES